jgi:hypothetical protein
MAETGQEPLGGHGHLARGLGLIRLDHPDRGLSGHYKDLPDYVIFAVLLFYILTIAGLFVLRRTRPETKRPYRAFGYPVLPALYIVAAGPIEICCCCTNITRGRV